MPSRASEFPDIYRGINLYSSVLVCSSIHKQNCPQLLVLVFNNGLAGYKLMNLLYNITFNPSSTFCVENFLESRSSLEENTISAIHLLPESLIRFHPSYPSFFISNILLPFVNDIRLIL